MVLFQTRIEDTKMQKLFSTKIIFFFNAKTSELIRNEKVAIINKKQKPNLKIKITKFTKLKKFDIKLLWKNKPW